MTAETIAAGVLIVVGLVADPAPVLPGLLLGPNQPASASPVPSSAPVAGRSEGDVSQEQSERSSPVALFVERTRRFRLWRTVVGLSMIGGLLLASVVVGQRWLGLVGIVIYALGSVLVVRDMARHASEARRPDRQEPARDRRQAILARLGWFLFGIALVAGGSIISVAA